MPLICSYYFKYWILQIQLSIILIFSPCLQSTFFLSVYHYAFVWVTFQVKIQHGLRGKSVSQQQGLSMSHVLELSYFFKNKFTWVEKPTCSIKDRTHKRNLSGMKRDVKEEKDVRATLRRGEKAQWSFVSSQGDLGCPADFVCTYVSVYVPVYSSVYMS